MVNVEGIDEKAINEKLNECNQLLEFDETLLNITIDAEDILIPKGTVIPLNGKTFIIDYWDTAGQEKFHSLIPSYIRNSTVAIFVYDITSRQSFDDLEKWHKIVTDVAEPKLVIAANKIDLDGERQVTEEEGKKWAEAHSAKFIETSARAPTNIDELFKLVGQTTVNEPAIEEAAPAEQANVIVDVKESEAPAKKGGCC